MSEARDVGNQPPDDDLRSLIASIARDNVAAAAAAEPDPAANGEQTGGEQQPSEEPTEPAGEDRPLGPQDTGDGEPGRSEGPETGEAAREEKKAAAPEHWSAEDKALFASLSSDADREKFLSLDKRREAGLTPRLQRAAELERDYGQLDQIFTPAQRALLAQNGLDPAGVVKVWHQIELNLKSGQTQDEWFGRIIHGYSPNRALSIARVIHLLQADPGEIAGYLNQLRGFAPQGVPQPNGYNPQQLPAPNGSYGAPTPQGGQNVVAHPALLNRLTALEADRDQRAQADWQTRYEAVGREIEAFVKEQDADGNLLHPYFGEKNVQDAMMGLAQLDRAQGRTPVIRELYDRAVWGNPIIRDKLQASQRTAEDRSQAAARKAKAEAAARAGASITGAPSPGQLPQSAPPELSIRDDIRAQLRARQ